MSPFPLPIFNPFPDALPSPPEHKPIKMIILVIYPEQSLPHSHPMAKRINATSIEISNNPTLKLTIKLGIRTQLKTQKGE